MVLQQTIFDIKKEMPAALPNNGKHKAESELDPGYCAGCGGKIVDRFYLQAVEQKWHVKCLKCVECQQVLDSSVTCFAREGNIYCKEDYYRRFAMKKCARCHLDISADELVMKARQYVYHIHCFTCATCHKLLSTGEYFGMRDEMIYCKTHYEQCPEFPIGGSPGGYNGGMSMPISGYHPDGQPGNNGGSNNPNDEPLPAMPAPQVPFYNGVGASQKGRPRKRKNQQQQQMVHDMDMAAHMGLNGDELAFTPDGLMMHAPRQKRIRTSFKHQQIRILKSYFSLNQNPDAKDLKQLAQKTGLTKRVLQVWFQNARAKYRRNLNKQDGGGDNSKNNNNNKQNGDISDSQEQQQKLNNSNMDGSLSPEFSVELPDIPNSRSPESLSDLSSTPSLSEFHGHHMAAPPEHQHLPHHHHHQYTHRPDGLGSASFGDLFNHVTASMNALG